MKAARIAVTVACTIFVCALVTAGTTYASGASPYIAVSPTKAPVGDSIVISGQGFPPETSLNVEWSTANVTWAIYGNPVPQVNGVNTVPFQTRLATVTTNASGYFSTTVTVPEDYNGQHIITAVSGGSDSPRAQAAFTLEPEFTFYPTSGPPGTPVTVVATGLGARLYAAEYHVLWDNNYLGYMSGVTTHGQANFTFYATGAVGVHEITIYNGYPGPAFLNSEQAPENVQITSYDPPLIPFHGQFNMTSPTQSNQGISAGVLSILGLGMIVGGMGYAGVLAVKPGFRSGSTKLLAIIVAIGLLVVGGTAMFLVYSSGNIDATGQTTSGYSSEAVTIRPDIIIPQTNATSGPRIYVTPDVATVGTPVNVTGLGFTPGTTVPLNWSTHTGSHINGFNSTVYSLRNVTANAAGTFSFTMKVPSDLGGEHYITAPDLAPNGNATLYIERSASISQTEGSAGTQIVITILGAGWTYQDNIVALDYDNSFIGYGCGFNGQGNITILFTVMGAPGYHSIGLYPSVYEGPNVGSTLEIYRYPILTPYDSPGAIPAFHFSFLVTQGGSSANNTEGVTP